MKETWKPAYSGRYEASSLGRIRSVAHQSSDGRRWRGKILKQTLWKRRYYYICTSFDGKRFFKFVHVLVARAFLGKCPHGKEVNHIDGNKKNTRAKNLEYTTRGGNLKHASEHGLMATKRNGRWRRKWRP